MQIHNIDIINIMSIIKTFSQFVNEKIEYREFKEIEREIDKIFNKYNIDVAFTKHFKERVNDDRNVRDITGDELVELFKKTAKAYGKKIATVDYDYEGVIKDLTSMINVPFIIQPNDYGVEDKMVLKTVMRKKDFKTDHSHSEDLYVK